MGQPVVPGTTLRWPRARALAGVVTLTGVMLLAGCGGDDEPGAATGSSPPRVQWTLVLDYEPNAVHAGVLRAKQAGYFEDAGIDLRIVAPSSTADALTQVTRGKADAGLSDLIDVARRNERAADRMESQGKVETETDSQVSVAAGIVQQPLSGLIVREDSGITKPEQLAGKKVAVSGLPSDVAVVEAIASKDGRPVATENITLGFNGLKALDAGRVDATTAYWPADEVTLEQLGTKGRTFALDRFGGPSYPGLVAFTSRRTAVTDPVHTKGFKDALVKGTQDVIANPDVGLQAVKESYPELDPATTEAQLANYVPLFGTKDTAGRADVAAFAEWAYRAKLTKRQLGEAEITAAVPEGVN